MDETSADSLKQLFERARALPADEQRPFLEEACGDDPAKQAELGSLLAAAEEAEGFFNSLADAVLSLSPWSDDQPSESSATVSGPDPLIGRSVRQYRIEEKLGRGGMGVVYRARDTNLDRRVALKFLPHHLGEDEAAVERFLVEARAAAALDHPNVCAVYEIGEDEDGRRFIAMAYYDGETLKQKLARGSLPIEEAADYAGQIAAGLGAAHKHDIVHRDIKPGNVIVTPEGVAKILDFGLAKLADVTLTGTGTTLGTAAYMSPEQTRGNAVDQRTDLWSLGVVLYEMLTGERPFRGQSTGVVIHAIQTEAPDPPSTLRPDIPRELEAVVGQLLAKDPDRRPPSVEALGLGTREATLPKGVFARPRGLWARLRSWQAVATMALGIAAITVWWFVYASSAAAQRIESLAVLPLEDLSGDSERQFVVRGIHDELITSLGRLGGVRVTSRTSVLQFEDPDMPAQEIAEALGVDAVMEGTVSFPGDSVRITARLIRVLPEERQAWAGTHQVHARDILVLYQTLKREIADALGPPLVAGQETGLSGAQEVDPIAYQLYLRGLPEVYQQTPASLARAIEYFDRSIEQDSMLAPAYAGLAMAYHYQGGTSYRPAQEVIPLIIANAEHALALDSTLAGAHAELGFLKYRFLWDWNGAEQSFQRAIELNESYAEAYRDYAQMLAFAGRGEECLPVARRAAELDPLRPFSQATEAACYYALGQPEKGLEHMLGLVPLFGDHPIVQLWLALAYQQTGRHEEALALYESLLRQYEAVPEFRPTLLGFAGISYGPNGQESRAVEVLDELEELRERGIHVGSEMFGYVHVGLGHSDEAIEWLERAYEEHDPGLCNFNIWPSWMAYEELVSDPRFQELRRKVLGKYAD